MAGAWRELGLGWVGGRSAKRETSRTGGGVGERGGRNREPRWAAGMRRGGGSRTACSCVSRLPSGEPRGSGGRGLVLFLGAAVPVVLAPVHGLGLRLPPWQVCVQQLRPGDRGQVPSQGRVEPRGPRERGYPGDCGKRKVFSPLFKFSLQVVGFLSRTGRSRAKKS